MINIEKIKEVYKILNKEFDLNMKDKLGTWEYHQLCLVIGETKELLTNISNPKELEKSNKIWKQIRGI